MQRGQVSVLAIVKIDNMVACITANIDELWLYREVREEAETD